MSKAIEQIVETHVRYGNRRALEDLRAHWQKLALDLKTRSGMGWDFSLPIGQIEEELFVIETGLDRLTPGPE
jgi:hypothetical protein